MALQKDPQAAQVIESKVFRTSKTSYLTASKGRDRYRVYDIDVVLVSLNSVRTKEEELLRDDQQRPYPCAQSVHAHQEPGLSTPATIYGKWRMVCAAKRAVALRGRWKEGRSRSGVPQEVRPVVPVTTGQPTPPLPIRVPQEVRPVVRRSAWLPKALPLGTWVCL